MQCQYFKRLHRIADILIRIVRNTASNRDEHSRYGIFLFNSVKSIDISLRFLSCGVVASVPCEFGVKRKNLQLPERRSIVD